MASPALGFKLLCMWFYNLYYFSHLTKNKKTGRVHCYKILTITFIFPLIYITHRVLIIVMRKIKGPFTCILAMDSYLSFLIYYLLYYIFFLSTTSHMYINFKSHSALILLYLIKFFDSENVLWLMMKLILLLRF